MFLYFKIIIDYYVFTSIHPNVNKNYLVSIVDKVSEIVLKKKSLFI